MYQRMVPTGWVPLGHSPDPFPAGPLRLSPVSSSGLDHGPARLLFSRQTHHPLSLSSPVPFPGRHHCVSLPPEEAETPRVLRPSRSALSISVASPHPAPPPAGEAPGARTRTPRTPPFPPSSSFPLPLPASRSVHTQTRSPVWRQHSCWGHITTQRKRGGVWKQGRGEV